MYFLLSKTHEISVAQNIPILQYINRFVSILYDQKSTVGFCLNFFLDLWFGLTQKWLPWIVKRKPSNWNANTLFTLGIPEK